MSVIENQKIDVNDRLYTPSSYQIQPRTKVLGRPLFDGKNENEVIAKLQYAFSIGSTSSEACNFADISTDSLYRYCRKYPEFRDKIRLLQTTPTLMARMTIFKAIQMGDVKTALWYLERKRPQEFSPRVAEQYQLSKQERRIKYLENVLFENRVRFSWAE
ncbi:MAG: hypothetical protein A2017_17740 [Lentisphaerae bacterium GWF2_44_16]|nr:MAG: hypothetical protein A2017_17740 [Lentisphaerae bacterium GWF2_44_16]HAU65852.1 hypothetical protein [Candidatus Uhrbacteria bacterium]